MCGPNCRCEHAPFRLTSPRAIPVLTEADRVILSSASRLVALATEDHVPACDCPACNARRHLAVITERGAPQS